MFRIISPERLGVILVLLASALAMSPNVADPDLWGHVQYGRDVLEFREIASTTSYSYTAEGFRWINHENLSEIVMAVIADSIGPLGLVLGKFLLSLLVVGVILRWNLHQGVGLIASCIVTLLVAANLGYHWSIRPQLSSFVGFTLLVLLLQWCFTGWRDRWHVPWPQKWFQASAADGAVDPQGRIDIRGQLGYDSARMRCLWLATLIFLVWANSHGGFVAGLCVYVLFLSCRAMEALFRGGRFSDNASWGLSRRMALMSLVAILATSINPYGPRLHLWLIESLGKPRPEISDWSQSQLFGLVGMKLWLMIGVVAFALALTRRKLDATQVLLLTITLWQSISHFRHVPFFVILCGFWLGPHLQSALQRLSPEGESQPISQTGRWVVQVFLVVAIVLVTGRLSHRLSDLQVQRDQFPVDAIHFMRQQNLHGRLVVTYDWAQYCIAALCSDASGVPTVSRVAFDGRFRTCYPQTIVDMHFDFLYGDAQHVERYRSEQSPPCDPSRVLQYKGPELVLLRRFGERTEFHMNQNLDRWVLLYQDGIAQVWGVRHLFDDPTGERYLAENHRIIHDHVARDSVTWPAIYDNSTTDLGELAAIQLAKPSNRK